MKANLFLSKYEAPLYAVLRIVTGFLFLWHGTEKLFDYPPAGVQIPPFIMYVGGCVEFFGGLLVLLGLFTHWATFFCSGEMAVAYWMAHGPHAVLPLVNHGEMAMLYCFLFLFISARGSGIFSIDSILEKK